MNAVRSLLLAGAACAALVSIASCGKDVDANPTIRIVAPASQSVFDSTSVFVEIEIEGFTLSTDVYDPPQTIEDETPARPFHGHWHLYKRAPGAAAFQFIDDQFTTRALLQELEPGAHEIVAELVNENHVPIYSTPLAYTAVEITDDARTIRITSPNGGFLFSSSVEVSVQVLEFTVDSAAVGQPNVEDEGHWHLVQGSSFTGALVAEGLATTVLATDLSTEGTGSSSLPLWAVLVNNDHTLVDPPVVDEIRMQVPANAPRIHLLSPAPGDTTPSPFDATVQVSNFVLVDPATAVADSSGQGHWHLLVDGIDQGVEAWGTSATGLVLATGEHEVRVELRTNLHAPLAPPVIDVSRVSR